MRSQTINENRGARRAAELRRRFAHVTDSSIGRQHFGLRSAPAGRGWGSSRSQQTRWREFLAWSALAGVMLFIGFLIF
jgi:hypothetical protein